ncbi:hypothetical protein [Desulfoscipio geothermicus]|uniref:Uncharacterized protein n=1 Tax=Desulfoscipio geothermicus DSM 3669 TaxID=1121426 RepID=A0A1I6ECA3_9FIRM|nr:hypothetical protein [Desulfoscipio geothermicus]SFR15267.1 hypothetical protein SAMN05660706_1356 [Desulfoscipio geothermicus DSM 3669]
MRIGYNPKSGRIKTDGLDTIDRGFIAHMVVSPAAAAADSVLAATALADGATTEVTEGITNPDYPRVLQIQGNQAGVAGNVVIEGTNMAGETITETIAANGANAVSGTKAFRTVTKITLPALVGAGDTISVGVTDVLGIPYKLSHDTVLAAYLGGVKEGTAPTVTTSATNLESNTIDLNSALDGSQVDVYLIV